MTQPPEGQNEDQKIVEVRETSCCIVGGGPAGLMLATLLARKKVPVLLLEQHQNFDRDFRGDTVHPSTLEVLDQLGWVEELLKKPHGKVSSLSLQLGGQRIEIADFGTVDTRFPYIALIPQVDFLDFIRQKVSLFPDFQVEMGANVLSLVEENGTVRGVRFKGRDWAWREVHASLVVGADGRFSRVRQLGGFEVNKSSPPMDILWFRLPQKPGDPQELLLIGDAAHVMSPVGGAGINYAVQDAVEAANLLAGPLADGKVEPQHLAAVQSARERPVKVIQFFQKMIQNRILAGVLASKGAHPGVRR